jgi:hypothetical protein
VPCQAIATTDTYSDEVLAETTSTQHDGAG